MRIQGAMAKPTKRKRPESGGAEEKIVASEVMLRSAALAYAAVANLDPSDPRWRRCWRALRLAATGMVAEIRETAGPPEGHPPSRALDVRPIRGSTVPLMERRRRRR